MAKNICQCPQPPGGRAVCEAHQLAVCRIIGGQVHTECVNPPASLSKGFSFAVSSTGAFDASRASHLRWALGVVTNGVLGGELLGGMIGKLLGEELLEEERRVLDRGSWTNPDSGENVTFRLPAPTKSHDSLESGSGTNFGKQGA